MRITLIHNPGAGSQAADSADRLVAMLGEAGHAVRQQCATDEDWTKCLDWPADAVAVAGGDGTVASVAAQARPYWPHIGLLLFCSLLTTPLSLLNPVPLKLIVDCVIGDHELPDFIKGLFPGNTPDTAAAVVAVIASILVFIALVRHGAEMGNATLRAWIAEKLVLRFRSMLFRHVQNLSLSFHDTKGAADTAYRIQYDAPAVRWMQARRVPSGGFAKDSLDIESYVAHMRTVRGLGGRSIAAHQ